MVATAFNLLRQEQGHSGDIAATYTFNGAGVGALNPEVRLTDVLKTFDLQRRNLGGRQIVFTDAAVKTLYDRLKVVPTLSQTSQLLRIMCYFRWLSIV